MPENFKLYLLPILIFLFVAWKIFKNFSIKRKLPEYLQKGAIFIDVRTPEEFKIASNPRCQNIPLDNFQNELKKFDPSKPVVLCCRSGYRSQIATTIMIKHGFKDVFNARAWTNIP